jgi:hypothetical protein
VHHRLQTAAAAPCCNCTATHLVRGASWGRWASDIWPCEPGCADAARTGATACLIWSRLKPTSPAVAAAAVWLLLRPTTGAEAAADLSPPPLLTCPPPVPLPCAAAAATAAAATSDAGCLWPGTIKLLLGVASASPAALLLAANGVQSVSSEPWASNTDDSVLVNLPGTCCCCCSKG